MLHITFGTTYVYKPSIHEVSPANSRSMTPSALPLQNDSIVYIAEILKTNCYPWTPQHNVNKENS